MEMKTNDLGQHIPRNNEELQHDIETATSEFRACNLELVRKNLSGETNISVLQDRAADFGNRLTHLRVLEEKMTHSSIIKRVIDKFVHN